MLGPALVTHQAGWKNVHPWKVSSLTLCRFGLWTAQPHQALIIPDSQLYSVSNVLFYAKNLIIDLFYVHLFISALADPVETI